jgi:hypothetical protein
MANSAWGELNWGAGTFGGQNDVTVLVTGEQLVKTLESNIGISAGGSVQIPASEETQLLLSYNANSVSFTIDGSVVPTTNLANLTLNNVTAFETVFVPVTAPGTPTTWGSNGWGELGWGENIGLSTFEGTTTIDLITPVNVVGELLSTSLNSVTITGTADVTLTGEELVHALESNIGVSAGGSVQVPIFESPLITSLGTVDPGPDANITGQQLELTLKGVFVIDIAVAVNATGQQLTTSLNSVNIDLITPVDVTGQNLTTAINSITITTNTPVNLTGNNLTGTTGQLYVGAWAPVNTGQSVVWTEVAA